MPKPRKPTEILKLTGAFRPDKQSDRLDTLPTAGAPTKPKKFGPDESECWDRVIAQWKGTSVVGAIDTAALVACCEMWGLYRQAVKLAQDCPTDKDSRCSATGYLQAFERLAGKFGMTPHDRASMKGTNEKPKDSLEELYG